MRCSDISFWRKRLTFLFDYKSNGVPISRVDSVLDLGTTRSSFAFSNHIVNTSLRTQKWFNSLLKELRETFLQLVQCYPY